MTNNTNRNRINRRTTGGVGPASRLYLSAFPFRRAWICCPAQARFPAARQSNTRSLPPATLTEGEPFHVDTSKGSFTPQEQPTENNCTFNNYSQ